MSKEDIDKAVKEAAQFEAQDKERKEAIDIRNNADSIVFQTKKTLEEQGANIDAAIKTKIEDAIKELETELNAAPIETITKEQANKIKEKQENLMKAAEELYKKAYEAEMAKQQANQATTDGSAGEAGNQNTQTNTDDNVVDGDFKEV